MSRKLNTSIGCLVACLLATSVALAGQTKQEVPGIRNFTRVTPSVGCGGATSPEAIPALKEMGFDSVVNFRLATEENANVEAEREAVEGAGLTYVHIPFNLSDDAPNPYAAVRDFLTVMADRPDASVYIHCASANRAGMMWMIKRVLHDGWTLERAGEEAEFIGLTNQRLRDFALDYIRVHRPPAGP